MCDLRMLLLTEVELRRLFMYQAVIDFVGAISKDILIFKAAMTIVGPLSRIVRYHVRNSSVLTVDYREFNKVKSMLV